MVFFIIIPLVVIFIVAFILNAKTTPPSVDDLELPIKCQGCRVESCQVKNLKQFKETEVDACERS